MIISTKNERIKDVIQLMSSAKARKEQGLYVVEGLKMFKEAPAIFTRQVFLTENIYEKLMEEEEYYKFFHFEIVSEEVFNKMSDTKTPQGIMCVMEKEVFSLSDLLAEKKDDLHILVLEGVQDPGNLGTMIRTAEGAGIDFILADKKTADLYNPKVIRSTMGSIFRVPFVYSENLMADIKLLKDSGVSIYAAHLKGDNNYKDEKFAKRSAVLIGNEGNGLSDEITEQADKLLKIPMKGEVESLNAAIAAALLMYAMA